MPKALVFKALLLFVLLATVIYVQTSLSPSDGGGTGSAGILGIFAEDQPAPQAESQPSSSAEAQQ